MDLSTPINKLVEINENNTIITEKEKETSNNINHFIIKPPQEKEIFKNKVKTFFLDSRDRNYNLFPKTSKFEICLKEEYKYIKSLNLVSCQIPNSQYIINPNNNILHFYIGNNENQDFFESVIQPGNYLDENPLNPNTNPKYNTEQQQLSTLSFQDSVFVTHKDELSIELQKSINKSILNNYHLENKPIIECGYKRIQDSYFFSSDLCPIDNHTYQGTKLNLCFKGDIIPYGNQDIEKVPKINQFDRIERDENGNILYKEIKIGEKHILYKKKTIGEIIGFDIKNYNGFIENNLNNTEDKLVFKINTITNSNKNFTDNLIENQYILIEQQNNNVINNQRFKIEKILNGHSFKIYDPNLYETGPNAPLIPPKNPNINGGIFIFENSELFSGIIQAPFRKNFTISKYVIMKISSAHKIDSQNDFAQNSFAVIPFEYVFKPQLVQDYSESIWKRNFNPPLPSLSELKISFFNFDGSYYDFNNYNVNLKFVIETLNQSMKYGN